MTDRCHKDPFFQTGLPCLILGLAGIGLSLLCGCHRTAGEGTDSEANLKPMEPVLVRTVTIPKEMASETRTFPVFAKEGQTVKLSFRVPGQLLEFNPILGAKVSEGEVVASLDKRDYELAVERLKKGIDEANAALTAMLTGARPEDVATLEAQVVAATTAKTNAEAQLKRMENLRRDGTASQVQYDLAKTTSDGATAQLETLNKQLEKAKKGARDEEIQAMRAKIAGLEVDLKLAENKLSDTDLKAPFNGVVSQKFFDNFETVAPGIAVLELVDAAGLEATLNVPEEIVLRKDAISKIECEFQGMPGAVYEGSVKEIGQTPRSGGLSYPLTVTLGKKTGGTDGQELIPGMSGTATIFLTGDSATITLPSAALVPEGTGAANSETESAVWLVADGKIQKRAVRVKAFTRDGAVVEDGLSGGETIVSAGARFLHEGEAVRTE